MVVDVTEPAVFVPSPVISTSKDDKAGEPVTFVGFKDLVSADDSDDDMHGQPSSSDSSPSSGRLKDSVVDAAGDVYRNMDILLRDFCNLHNLPFTRAFNLYLKQHSGKTPGENPWNTYTKLHAHRDHTARELDRIGYTTEQFDLLDSDAQQKVRSRCWKKFQKSFASSSEYRTALELFNRICAIEEKDKGTTVAKRQKVFGALMNKLSRIVRDSSLMRSV